MGEREGGVTGRYGGETLWTGHYGYYYGGVTCLVRQYPVTFNNYDSVILVFCRRQSSR